MTSPARRTAICKMESAYREFVYSYALTVPAEFRVQLGAVLGLVLRRIRFSRQPDERTGAVGGAGLLERCFDGSGDIAFAAV